MLLNSFFVFSSLLEHASSQEVLKIYAKTLTINPPIAQCLQLLTAAIKRILDIP
jgi:hypothetical protein